MVMRNRFDQTDAPGWWDDLPPAVRQRFSPTSSGDYNRDRDLLPAAAHTTGAGQPSIIRDLSRLAILFLVVAIANLLFLLVALTFLVGGEPVAH